MKRTGIKNRVNNKSKENKTISKATLFFILLIIVGLVGIFTVIYFVSDSTSMTLKEETYQYFMADKVTYKSGTNVSSEYMEIIENDNRYGVDPTPFYSTNTDRIYLSHNYAWHDIDNDQTYRFAEFTSIEFLKNYYELNVNNKKITINNGFLFDSDNNYIFLDYGTLTINNQKYDVTPLSFCSSEYNMIRIYNYETKELTTIDTLYDITYDSNQNYSVDVKKGLYQYGNGDQFLLVASSSNLKSIEDIKK